MGSPLAKINPEQYTEKKFQYSKESVHIMNVLRGHSLEGKKVKIHSNPFVSQDITAHIAFFDHQDQKMLLWLNASIDISGVIYKHAIAVPQTATESLEVLLHQEALPCAITWVPFIRFNADTALDLSWWRGRAFALTHLSLC